MIELFKVSFSLIFNEFLNALFFKVSMVRFALMYSRGFVPYRMTFMAVFAGKNILEFLLPLSVYFFKSGICKMVNL